MLSRATGNLPRMTKAIIGNLQMFSIDSHNRNIKDCEKHILTIAFFKETSFK